MFTDNSIGIAFDGIGAGQLLITTRPTSLRDYYQVRVIAENYDRKAQTFQKHLMVDASHIEVGANKVIARGDSLTQQIELTILDATTFD
jgi:hypothetical protein